MTNPENKWTFFECVLTESDSDEFDLLCKSCADAREFDERLGYCKLTIEDFPYLLDSDESTDRVNCTQTGLHIDYDDETKYFDCVVEVCPAIRPNMTLNQTRLPAVQTGEGAHTKAITLTEEEKGRNTKCK